MPRRRITIRVVYTGAFAGGMNQIMLQTVKVTTSKACGRTLLLSKLKVLIIYSIELFGPIWMKRKTLSPSIVWYQYWIRQEIELANFDLKSAKNYEQTDLDATLLRVRLTKYCERLRMWMPDKITDKWLIDQMLYLNLLRKDRTGTVSITNAGLLLFCKNPQQFISSANTIVRFSGPLVWLRQVFDDDGIVEDTVEKIIDGNLWVQLNDIMEALTLVNRPFRLKSETSVDVLPYDPIALKEVVVNSLVHRDYESCDSNIIEIRPDIITLSNPGGLVEEVLPSMEEEANYRGITKRGASR